MAARVLEWIGNSSEAEEILKQSNSWDSKYYLGQLLQKAGRKNDAYDCAQSLIQMAPWRAESYDLLALIAEKFNDTTTQQHAKQEGDALFDQEMKLFDELRSTIAGC